MRIKRTVRAISPYINVTPLIDVLLVLLIIFMVVTPLKPSRFKALIPRPPLQEPDVVPNDRALVVTIEPDLRLRLNQLTEVGSSDDTSKLSAELAQIFQKRKEAHLLASGFEGQTHHATDERVEKTVFIKAPRSIRYGEVAKVIDGVRSAGAYPVGLQIDELSQ